MTHFIEAKGHFEDLEHKIDLIAPLVASSDMHNDEHREEFVQLIKSIRQENRGRFSDNVWRRINQLLEELREHQENQIAQGIITNLKEAEHDR